METIFRAVDLRKLFPVRRESLFKRTRRFIHAVGGVSFEIEKGETFGIVGESGCGKTTLARVLLRLIEPTSGKIFFKDKEITSLNRAAMKRLRGQMQMIFQDPFSSLNPRKNIFDIIAEPLRVHKVYKNGSAIREKVEESLKSVELPSSESFMSKRPDELSGGERQRVGISRALIVKPELVVADEPVSMLDAIVKAGITSLMMGLKDKIGLTYIFITHEMSLAYYICDRIAVMYLGKVVELGKAEDVIKMPLHPYTRLLVEAIPPLYPDDEWGRTILERGELPLSIELPRGCRFHPRCSQAEDDCKMEEPRLVEVRPGYYVACHKCEPPD